MYYSKEYIQNILLDSDMNLTEDEVFDAFRRGWSDLENASNNEIVEYFSDYSDESMVGVISNVKGIAFEMEIERAFDSQGLDANLFDEINHPGTDIYFDNGQEFSIKSGTNIEPTLEDLDEGLDVIATTEIADVTDAIDGNMLNLDLVYSIASLF